MRRPVIGITMDYGDKPKQYMLPYDYTTSIERAGGLPWPLPFKSDLSLIPDFVDRLDGILFSGGDDLDPALFGETRHPNAEPIDPDRQRFELALIAEVERRRMPALGICLGCQLMNVHRGGSLIQFLPDQERDEALEHRRLAPGDSLRRHAVKLEPGTRLAAAIGKGEISVNTRHKQSVNRTGKGLRVIAKHARRRGRGASKTRPTRSSWPSSGTRKTSATSRNTWCRSSCWWNTVQMQDRQAPTHK